MTKQEEELKEMFNTVYTKGETMGQLKALNTVFSLIREIQEKGLSGSEADKHFRGGLDAYWTEVREKAEKEVEELQTYGDKK